MRRALIALVFSYLGSVVSYTLQAKMSAHLATQCKTWSKHDAAVAAQSFKAAPFNAVWWGRNSHAHTIIGSGEVSKRIFRKEGPKVAFRRERFDTPDADFIDVDFLDPIGSTAATGVSKLAVLTHGLESSSDAPLTSKMALSFARRLAQQQL
jgi:predicted alpha/beta-fold hydrolase